MLYTKPTILAAVDANAAIQNGTGNTAIGLPKDNHHLDNPGGQDPSLVMSTTSAYEADE